MYKSKQQIIWIGFSQLNFHYINEGLCGKRPQVTFDVMSNSPFSHKQIQGNLEGESGR